MSSDQALVWTPAMESLAYASWVPPAYVGIVLNGLLLLLIGSVYCHRDISRKYLDRVSFRLVVVSLISNLGYTCSLLATGLISTEKACRPGEFFLMWTLQFGIAINFCIALNIQLVLVNGVRGKWLEPCYYLAATLITSCLTIPTVAKGGYGFSEIFGSCWYVGTTRQRVGWELGTSIVPTLLYTLGEVLVFVSIAMFLSRAGRNSRTLSSRQQTTNRQALHNRSRVIVMRVSLYPIAAIILCSGMSSTDLYLASIETISKKRDFNVLIADNIFFGLRGLVYPLLAATDPSLLSALYAVYTYYRGLEVSDSTGTPSRSSGPGFNTTLGGANEMVSIKVEIDTVRHVEDEINGIVELTEHIQDPAPEEEEETYSFSEGDTSKSTLGVAFPSDTNLVATARGSLSELGEDGSYKPKMGVRMDPAVRTDEEAQNALSPSTRRRLDRQQQKDFEKFI